MRKIGQTQDMLAKAITQANEGRSVAIVCVTDAHADNLCSRCAKLVGDGATAARRKITLPNLGQITFIGPSDSRKLMGARSRINT